MNREAKALGMVHTHFQNPAGITMPEHYSTAADLARLSAAWSTKLRTICIIPSSQVLPITTIFTAPLTACCSGLKRGRFKTGFTRAAGYNLALTANRPTYDMELPTVV